MFVVYIHADKKLYEVLTLSFFKKFLFVATVIIIVLFGYSYLNNKPKLDGSANQDPVKSEQKTVLLKTRILPEKAVHALARFGQPKYPASFDHFSYVNPDAPKGGALRLGTVGTFDTINKDIVKGIGVEGILLTFDPLMMRSAEEPFTLYGVIAQGVEVAPDSSSVTYYLNPNARFHDDSPVTAEDVKYTIETLRDKGLPRYRQFYSRITQIEVVDAHTIKMDLKPNDDGKYDPELPLIVANVRVLSKAQLEKIDFAESGLTVIIGSGPYKIANVDQGRSVTYQRDPNYWAKDLPVNRGQYNFDTIKIEYFKNAQAQFQAFTAGEFDIYFETNPSQWETAYNFAAVNDGKVKRVDTTHKRPVAVRAIIFNMRRPVFNDLRVRKALNLAFDFDTLNKIVFSGVMKCPNSLFANTFLAHHGPAEGKEKESLEKFASRINPELLKTMLEKEFAPAQTDGNGDQRVNLEQADALLKQAGWLVKDGKRVNDRGQVMTLEFMIKDPKLEKIALAYRESVKKLGIDMVVRMMDAVQYENRVIESDFDMIIHTWANSLSPGNEQLYYFSAKNADAKGSSNYIGVKDPVAEELAREVTMATDLESLSGSVHALDRYVMYNYFQIPLAYDNTSRWAYWVARIAMPEVNPEVGTNVMNWGWAPVEVKG